MFGVEVVSLIPLDSSFFLPSFVQKLGRLTWAIKTFDEKIDGPSELDIATMDEKTWIVDGV